MHFEIMPDAYTYWGMTYGSIPYVFPRFSNVYGPSDYTNRVATVDNVAYNAVVRSSQFNKLYYNPAITYIPWVQHNRSLYPNANPECALHNPQNPLPGTTFNASYCRNLTVNNENSSVTTYWRTCNSTDCTGSTTNIKTFWPATYFYHNGGDQWNINNYNRVEIRDGNTYQGHGRESRTDCVDAPDGICTYEEEIQNFANWYTYYRSVFSQPEPVSVMLSLTNPKECA
jgi:type IV pilus assembly protein PilY1